jgi:Transposase DDE domain
MKSTTQSPSPVLPEISHLNNATIQSYFKDVSVTRITSLILLIACILDGRSSNIQKASQRANKLSGKDHPVQKVSSIYAAFKRLFQNGNTDRLTQGLFCLTVRCLQRLTGSIELVMDRTHWEFRGTIKNVLVLGCVYHGIFIPLVYKDLAHKGNSSFKERQALIELFLTRWTLTKLPLPPIFLAGDREFIGVKWWAYLVDKNIQFSFRIREGQSFHIWINNNISDVRFKANLLRTALGNPKLKHQEIVILGQYILDLFICKNVTPNATEKHIYIVTNFDNPQAATEFYRKRWTIEVCFKHLKSNGFDLEATGVEGDHKIDLLFGMISFVYTLCVMRGILTETENPPKMNLYTLGKTKKRFKQTSSFTTGYENIIQKMYDVFDFAQIIYKTIFVNHSFSTS